MFTETGWYKLFGKTVFVQELMGILHWWTLEDGWHKLSEIENKSLVLFKSVVVHKD